MATPKQSPNQPPPNSAPADQPPLSPLKAARRQVRDILDAGAEDKPASFAFDVFIITLILLNVVAFIVETIPEVHAEWHQALYAFETFSVAVFTVEYAARIWTAVELPFLSRMAPWRARLTLARSPAMIIDLLAILPYYLSSLFAIDLRVLRLLRLLRFLKLSRYSPAISTLIRVLAAERRALYGAGLLLMMAVLFSASIMYSIENDAQPDKFGSVPQAMWWAITTLSTVGYGDVTPITPLGKIFGGMTMIVGLCILALPVAIIASGFSQELAKRDFVVNWSLISRVPLLAEMDADDVAQVMGFLHAQALPPHVEIVGKGAPADAMFIVASGQVDHHGEDSIASFAAGDVFGVELMLSENVHSGAFVTRSKCKILKLSRDDFHRLEVINPDLARRMRHSCGKQTAQT